LQSGGSINMEVFKGLIQILTVLSGLVVIVLVLVQHGKGADMGAAFGSGSAGSLFGATGSANFLSRTTAVCATIFFCSAFALVKIDATAVTSKDGIGVMSKPEAVQAAPVKPATDSSKPTIPN